MDDRGIARCCGASALASGRPGFSVCSIKPDRCRPGWGDEVSTVALPADRKSLPPLASINPACVFHACFRQPLSQDQHRSEYRSLAVMRNADIG